MSALERRRTLELALRLVRRRAKLSIARAATGLPLETLRGLHRELHGEPPRGGPLACGLEAAIRTRVQQAHASLFAALYAGHAGTPRARALDYPALIDAYESYLALLAPDDPPRLSVNLAWAAATDLRAGRAVLVRCGGCAAPYLSMRTGAMGTRCPICALYARR